MTQQQYGQSSGTENKNITVKNIANIINIRRLYLLEDISLVILIGDTECSISSISSVELK